MHLFFPLGCSLLRGHQLFMQDALPDATTDHQATTAQRVSQGAAI